MMTTMMIMMMYITAPGSDPPPFIWGNRKRCENIVLVTMLMTPTMMIMMWPTSLLTAPGSKPSIARGNRKTETRKHYVGGGDDDEDDDDYDDDDDDRPTSWHRDPMCHSSGETER